MRLCLPSACVLLCSYALDVGCVVGPPYAIMGIQPKMGPLTGNQRLRIEGESPPTAGCERLLPRPGPTPPLSEADTA